MNVFSHWVAGLYADLSYGHIILLMTMEGSVFPVPSALVVLPAGYMARVGQLDPVLVWLSGATGIFIGSCFNYTFARTLGRVLVVKYGRYFLITDAKYRRAESFFMRNAWVALSVGRLMPVINRALPLPAGVFKMKVISFALATAAGAGLHSLFWFSMGYFFGASAMPFLKAHSVQFAICFFGVPLLLMIAFAIRRRVKTRRHAAMVGTASATPTINEALP